MFITLPFLLRTLTAYIRLEILLIIKSVFQDKVVDFMFCRPDVENSDLKLSFERMMHFSENFNGQ